MPTRMRGVFSTGAILIVVLALEAFGLRNGTTGLIIIAALAAIAVGVIAFRVELKWAGVAAALACSFTLTWNGWFLGPVRPGDVLILLTLIILLLANPNDAFRTPPWWVKQLALAILVVAVLTVFFPPDPIYLSQRIVLGAKGQATVDTKGSITSASLGVAFKYIIAVFATPLAFIGAARVDRRAVRWLGMAFAAGAALSGWAATADHFGANIGHLITRLPNVGSRQVGFATQPNFLAAGLVLAIPFGFWLTISANRRDRLIGIACLPGLVGGVYASGSRGGSVCAVLVIALCLVIHPRTRKFLPLIVLAGAFLVGVVVAFVPSAAHEILKVTRLSNATSTSGSDTVRAIVGAQGVRDFQHAWLHGIGLQASFDASQVFLQELAAGGLILFIAMQTYMLGGIFTAWHYIKRHEMAIALFASLVVTLGLDYFEADLTDRFYYVPAAILLALVQTADGDAAADAESDAESDAQSVAPASYART